MAKHEMVVAHIEKLLEKITGDGHIAADDEGDWHFDFETSQVLVRVMPGDDPYVLVYAGAAMNVQVSPDLYEFLNGVNSQLRMARSYWQEGTVFVEMETLGNTIDQDELAALIETMGQAADAFGPKIVELFGGKTPHEPTSNDVQSTAAETPGSGGYL